MQRGAGFLKYVESHIDLRQTFATARLGTGGFTLAEAANGDASAIEQAVVSLTALGNMFIELYADCADYPVDSVIRDAAALMYGDPSR